MGKEKKYGQIILLMREPTKWVLRKDSESTFGQRTMQATKENGKVITLLDQAVTIGEMEELIKDIGTKIIWRVSEFISGLKEEFMRASLKMIKNMVMVFTGGLMVEIFKGGGMKGNNMDWGYTQILIIKKLNVDFGRWERE